MTTPTPNRRGRDAVLGALVADAASLGLHWIYDPARTAEVGGDRPEFQQPDGDHYQGVAGYFAHDGKRSGDSTHYGEQLLVALRSLADSDGEWKPFHYLATFIEHFDRGGSFNGYIDASTSGTLDRSKAANDALLKEAEATAPGIEDYPLMIAKKYSQLKGRQLSGDELVTEILKTARILFNDPKTLDDVEKVVRHYDEHRSFQHGADDNQVPAFSKIPPLVARFAGSPDLLEKVEQAVRITNDNDEAVAYSRFGAAALEGVILSKDIPDAIRDAAGEAGEAVREKALAALAFPETAPAAIGEKFGMVCYVNQAFPTSVAVLKQNLSFIDGVRANILASGDNAGRSIFVGAMLGAAHGINTEDGIPFAWLAQVDGLSDHLALIDRALS